LHEGRGSAGRRLRIGLGLSFALSVAALVGLAAGPALAAKHHKGLALQFNGAQSDQRCSRPAP